MTVRFYLFETEAGPWLWHEDRVTMIGRLKIYWWWPGMRPLFWIPPRFWIGGKQSGRPNQTNTRSFRVWPLYVEWWGGA